MKTAKPTKPRRQLTDDMIAECQAHLETLGCDVRAILTTRQLNWVLLKLLGAKFDWDRDDRAAFRAAWPVVKDLIEHADKKTVVAALRRYPALLQFWPNGTVPCRSVDDWCGQQQVIEHGSNVVSLTDWRRRSPSPPPSAA
jgi:hypothetical protein